MTTSDVDWPPRPKRWDGRFWLTSPASLRLKRYWLGIANSSPRNTTAPLTVRQVGLVSMESSRPWWYEWKKRIGIGAIDVSRVRCPILDTILLPARSLRSLNGMVAHSDYVDQSFRSHADQIGAKRRRALLV